MNKHILLAASLVFEVGCKDSPYQDPIHVIASEPASYAFTGMVELGTPITNATITAYEFSGLTKGERIGETISNLDGSFELPLKTNYDGSLLLTASGGSYRDLTSGEIVAMKPSQSLKSAITHIKMPEKTNINAWTTMATARVMANQGFWDKSISELSDIDRINADFSHVSYFLSGKSTKFVNIRRQDFFDIDNESIEFGVPKVSLHLAHGGLSQMARDFTFSLAEEGIIVSVLDLVMALDEDLSDRILDGRSKNGNVIYLGNNYRIDLNSYTMRKHLAESIFLYGVALRDAGKLTGENNREIRSMIKIIDSIADDARPELFPEHEKPIPFDTNPPEVNISFAGNHADEKPFAVLDGDVFLAVSAKDDSKIFNIRLMAPEVSNNGNENKFGPISINHHQNAQQIAKECGKKEFLVSELKEREILPENVVCACAEATDIFGNANRELTCFQRAEPQSQIELPIDKATYTPKDFANGVNFKAIVTSGLFLSECSWSVRDAKNPKGGEKGLPSGVGKIDGNVCLVEELIVNDKMKIGSYLFEVKAMDTAGRRVGIDEAIVNENFISFKVIKNKRKSAMKP